MEIGQDLFIRAVNDGLRRAAEAARGGQSEFSAGLDNNSFSNQIELLQRLVRELPGEFHERFGALFVELAALAVAMRIVNKESRLGTDELRAFAFDLAWFLNSFKHR